MLGSFSDESILWHQPHQEAWKMRRMFLFSAVALAMVSSITFSAAGGGAWAKRVFVRRAKARRSDSGFMIIS